MENVKGILSSKVEGEGIFERVLADGVFAAATRLYGITFARRDDLRGYTNECRVYEVHDVDDRPFAAGIPVGTVTAVISPAGRATVTAVVEPAMALSRSRVVGVLRTEPRAEPRPAVTAGAS